MPDTIHKKRRQQREGRLEIVAELYKKGWSIRQIRVEVMRRLELATYSKDTCWKDIKMLLAEWRESRIEDMDMAVQLELERIDSTIRELWEQWERSKQNYKKSASKQKGSPRKGKDGGEVIKTFQTERTTTEVIMLGDPAYISEIRAQLVERRKLLGLYAPEKKDIAMNVADIDLTDLTDAELMQILEIANKKNADT